MACESLTNLIQRCIAGDSEAKAELCAEYRELVEQAVVHALSRYLDGGFMQSDADQICNEVFIRR